MADEAARPACIGLAIEPKLATTPPVKLAASDSATRVAPASRPRRKAAAAVAAIGPITAVGCQPLSW
ncbi:MAG: hypothetical protein V9G23_06170 [Giesbergeria sp.]